MTNEGQLYNFDLDRSGAVPLYFRVTSRIEEAIRSGAIPPGPVSKMKSLSVSG